MESSAASVLQRAVEMDKKEEYTMALVLYQEGLQALVNSIKETKDATKKKYFHGKASEYMDRAEKIKTLVEERKAIGNYREHKKVEDGSTGNSYATLFGRFLDETVTHIQIEDPYIRLPHQCQNLVRLCELAVQMCKSLSRVTLITTRHPDDAKNQLARLMELKGNMQSRLITFEFSFSDTLHDRKITLSNGWVIKIGRGLDYFKPPGGKFVLGAFDMELRSCLETAVDIYYFPTLAGKQ
ncbi:MIT domain-containing protein 1-like [Cephus cinctus]|uniref:MIT domain-containing protein 1-like n=1 Tax=Cephus cinctus TaxID=211228 RepID=A0AAJ7FTL8_CEPCN|nr:MIT domain-containing protein 1-like [Cephus cinctus]XP_015607700.1 MIT domain-containing protein 1-like [Cephus cinctus]